jgi:hypothetical protein
MKKLLFLSGLSACLFAFLFVASCKKEKDDDDKPKTETLDPQAKQHNDDANSYKGEVDQADDDINQAIEDYPSMSGNVVRPHDAIRSVLSSPLCGATIDSSQLSSKKLIFNFDGVTSCFSPSRIRSGQIVVQLTTGTYWKDAGSILTITYNNFKVTRQSDNKSIMFNGVKTLKNINGNDWIGFLLGTSTFRYQERASNINVTFDNSLSATWNSARMTEWHYYPPHTGVPDVAYAFIAFSSSGDTTVNGYNNADSWGVNRFGYSFTTYYNSAVSSNSYCGLWRFTNGELVHHVNNKDYTLTLGVDPNGSPYTGPCAYGYKVSWTSQYGPMTVVLSY